MNLYALFDRKADAYTSFHAERSDPVATRQFSEAVVDPKSVMHKYPDDFQLVRLVRLPESSLECIGAASDDAFLWEHIVVVSARQVLDLQPVVPADAQLSLIKEA